MALMNIMEMNRWGKSAEMNIIDLSYLIENDMPTCGTPWHQKVNISFMGQLDTVGRNTHSIMVGSHTGTHMDAPYHFIQNGKRIHELKVEDMIGDVTIVDFRRYGERDIVTEDVIRDIKVTEKMLFVFGWNSNWKQDTFYKDFTCFSREAIRELIRKGMRFMAMDTPSPDAGGAIQNQTDGSENHVELLKNNVIIVEYLTNTELIDMEKNYEIIALPLKISGSDGSPCRVVLREK